VSPGLRRPGVLVGRALGAAILALLAVDGLAQEVISGNSAPIEITADSLEVRQNRQVATFTGEVDAVQGDLVLSADQLLVYYSGNGGAGQVGASSTSIRRIEAFGNVFLSSPEETAQGEAGVYQVASRTVTLEGSVVLTKGQNVIRGERLEYNLDTGRSQIFSRPKDDQEVSPDGRVRAVFVPGDKDAPEAAAAERKQSPGRGASSEPRPPAPAASKNPAPAASKSPAATASDSPAADGGVRSTATWPPRPPQPKPALDG
jgi:lipopolysaccharide export system protein LptA